MEWKPVVKTKVIEMPQYKEIFKKIYAEFTVTEISEGQNYRYKHYWVHCFNDIDTIVFGHKVSGKGASKYKSIILQAVELFKLDGLTEEQVVRYPPHSEDFFNNPGVMYDCTDYAVYEVNNIDVLEERLKRIEEFYKSNEQREIIVNPENACILKLPLDQELITRLWNYGESALKEYITSQIDRLF